MNKIKLIKVEEAAYKCKAVYEWEDQTIFGDDSCLGGDRCYWHCEPLFKGHNFRTLKGVKKALELYQSGELTKQALEDCEEL